MHRLIKRIEAMNDKFKIQLKIDGRSYPMRIIRSEEAIYREAARLIEKRLSDYKELYKKTDLSEIDFLTIVATHYSVAFLKLKETRDFDAFNNKIQDLTTNIEEFLKQK